MYLKSIELSGFKSFAKKSTLSFNAPVTSIVGPNGSGKSNVVESIRFVLGEQSIKSLRGKSGADMIFKGSKSMPKLSRASVSIVFDNTKKVFSLATITNANIKLDYDEITISREVYADGSNKYLINGTEVRLKDVHELVSSVNIGSSGHHIISQGEADRILNASSKDRRGMVEDALGLKVYQYRLKESERKMEKTKQNIKEATSLRREIAPHISFLKKQVEKIEKAEEMRNELELLSLTYLKREEHDIAAQKEHLDTEKKRLSSSLKEVEETLSYKDEGIDPLVEEKNELLKNAEQALRDLRSIKDDISRKLGRIEGVIEFEESKAHTPVAETIQRVTKTKTEIEMFIRDVVSQIEQVLGLGSIKEAAPHLENIRRIVQDLLPHDIETKPVEAVNAELIAEMKGKQAEIVAELEKIALEEDKLYKQVEMYKDALRNMEADNRKKDQSRFEHMMKKNELMNALSMNAVKEESLKHKEVRFVEDVKEIAVLVGPRVLEYKQHEMKDDALSQDELHKKIERIKIKLEDAGAIGGGEVMKEYQEATERDAFLSREIEDLTKSMEDIDTLIRELKVKLDTEFKSGIEKINVQFQKFFALMFGGGTAFLSVIVETKKKKKGLSAGVEEEEEEVEETDGEESFEHGIDINISLPQKKVKELTMLSGGERSLTSIALLFAISQVNPPPFLVLDETDAALDESNSRRYGDMIETLATYSQLVVVTHNRETMSRANVLYGVTLGADGASKLLSIKFDEATAFAK